MSLLRPAPFPERLSPPSDPPGQSQEVLIQALRAGLYSTLNTPPPTPPPPWPLPLRRGHIFLPDPKAGPLLPETPDLGRGLARAGLGPSSGLQMLLKSHLGPMTQITCSTGRGVPGERGYWSLESGGVLQGEGMWPPLPHNCPPPNPPTFPESGTLSYEYTRPGLWKGVGGRAPEAWNKETKPHGPPAHLSSPWTGSSCSHSPASTRPWAGGPQARQAPPFLHPSSQPRPEAGYRDRSGLRWAGGWGTKWGTVFLQRSEHTETQAQGEMELRVGDPKAERGQASQSGGGRES